MSKQNQLNITPALKLGAIALAVVLQFGAALTARAADLKLALSSPPTGIDPHFHNASPNLNVSEHIFEALTKLDADSKILPGVAQSWRLVNDTTWEFKIRPGLKFHDGSEVTAEDVAWSLERPATITTSPGKFDVYTKQIASKKIVDKLTIHLVTSTPYPLMLTDLSQIAIVSKKVTQGLNPEDFAQGKGMVGTGPFKFVSYRRDDRVELERYDAYWGEKPAWDKVTLLFLANNGARMAALLAGDVNAIENVPTPDLPRVKSDAKLKLASKISGRTIYLYLDTARSPSPHVTDKSGAPLAKSPLTSPDVRRAISMAINREGIKTQLMEGLAEPTNNMVPPMLFGFNPDLKTVAYDPTGAKKLLEKAGYPDGFGLTLHTPNNRYINDEKISQAVAQNLSRIGISTKVDAMPMSSYVGKGAKKEFSLGLLGWGTVEISSPLRSLLACEDAKKGFGTQNWSNYCNPEMTALLEKGLTTVDDKERLKLMQNAIAIAVNDAAIIPLHQQFTTWAMQKNFSYVPRTDERTLAIGFKPAAP